jgi:uncharacterized membrane protein YkvI
MHYPIISQFREKAFALSVGRSIIANMSDERDRRDVPLPGTLAFVLALGIAYFIGWFALFVLLAKRW